LLYLTCRYITFKYGYYKSAAHTGAAGVGSEGPAQAAYSKTLAHICTDRHNKIFQCAVRVVCFKVGGCSFKTLADPGNGKAHTWRHLFFVARRHKMNRLEVGGFKSLTLNLEEPDTNSTWRQTLTKNDLKLKKPRRAHTWWSMSLRPAGLGSVKPCMGCGQLVAVSGSWRQ
jgi:hypothetical protein